MTRRKAADQLQAKAATLTRLSVEYVPLDAIQPNAYNPNRQSDHEFDLLLRSMREDGFTQPVVAVRIDPSHRNDERFAHYPDGTTVIVDGEHRWRAAAVLRDEGRSGYDPCPVVYTPMTPAQMRIATLRHNRARGSEDEQLAADVLRDLETLGALDWAAEALMLTDADLQLLLSDVAVPDALASDTYGEAWQPHTDDTAGSMGADTGITPAGLQAQRDAEAAAAQAHTEEDRIKARREANVYRLALTFSGDEGALVKRVLGDQPAQRLLDLCHATEQ